MTMYATTNGAPLTLTPQGLNIVGVFVALDSLDAGTLADDISIAATSARKVETVSYTTIDGSKVKVAQGEDPFRVNVLVSNGIDSSGASFNEYGAIRFVSGLREMFGISEDDLS